jgi:poly-gamma-glutamate synthesis protein (capsule biosynthesis protein)
MKYKVFKKAKYQAQLASLFHWNRFHYPQPVKGKYNVAGDKMEMLIWAYKCWVRQMEVAEKGSGIERYFAEQTLKFAPPDGFVPEKSLRVSAGGDLMAVDALTYEYTTNLFDGIKDFYFDADLVCSNLESTVYDKAPVGRNQAKFAPPRMNIGEKMLDRFVEGINYFSTANNHCCDYGEEGLLATLDALSRRKCWYSGTNRSAEEQEDVLIVEINGIRMAMLAYTFEVNPGTELDKDFLANVVRFNDETCDTSLVKRHIAKAREKGADIIIGSLHWGWEFEMYPHKNVMDVAHRLADEGIDVILGAHPHVSQPMERYKPKDGAQRECLIVYSLGDFVSYHPLTKNSKLTYVLRFKVEKGRLSGKAKTIIRDLEVMPVYILVENKPDDTCDCRLMPFEKVLACGGDCGLSAEERRDLGRLDRRVWRKILMPKSWFAEK